MEEKTILNEGLEKEELKNEKDNLNSTEKKEDENIETKNEKELKKECFDNKEEDSKNEKNEKEGKTINNKKQNKKINKKHIIIGVAIVLILLAISTILSIININNRDIVSGVKIKGIEVSGLSQEEAKNKLETIYNEKREKEISIKYEEYESTINPTIIETNYNVEKAVDEAMSIGKSKNIFKNNFDILMALLGKKDINVEMTINDETAKETIESLGAELPGTIVESSYYQEGEYLIITKGKEGIAVDTQSLLDKIKERLNDINVNNDYIDIPVINKTPKKIDIDKIHEEIYKEVKDAYYTKEPFTIYPEVIGLDFDVEDAKKVIETEAEQYSIKLIITKPKVTTNDIGSEAFPDLLATFTTRYDASSVDRTTNLRLACQKLDGKVVLAGDVFSYNKTLGERTVAAGYKNAKVYENGEVVDGIGGGICQISSTLYNAVLMSNMEVTERRNHQFVTSYLPAGRDATVVYGQTDFKFKNTRTYAIRIKASVSNGIATVSIYGIKENDEYDVSFQVNTISTIPYAVKYEEDASMENGKEKIKQKGTNGIITETYIIKKLNGAVVSKKLLSKDTYNAMQRIIIKGTKESSNDSTTVNTNENNEQVEEVITTETKNVTTTTETDEGGTETQVDNTNE